MSVTGSVLHTQPRLTTLSQSEVSITESETPSQSQVCITESETPSQSEVCITESETPSQSQVCITESETPSQSEVCITESETPSQSEVCITESETRVPLLLVCTAQSREGRWKPTYEAAGFGSLDSRFPEVCLQGLSAPRRRGKNGAGAPDLCSGIHLLWRLLGSTMGSFFYTPPLM